MATRKNVRNLTSTEKQNFIDAIKAVKADGIYDVYVNWHIAAMSYPTPSNTTPSYRNAAHRGPAFLPWHRYYLHRLELQLQAKIPDVTIPYWDWTQDTAAPASSPIWTADFMGGNGDPNDRNLVKTGSFAVGQWTIVDNNGNPAGGLRRRFGQQATTVPNQTQVNTALSETPYDRTDWNTSSNPSHRNRLEGFLSGGGQLHNQVHRWVGGDMLTNPSPNDPVFFLHHANVDRLWAIWQANNPSQGYLPASGGPTGHNLNDSMYPWNGQATSLTATPANVLSITALGYDYA
ncbi:tyrosinase [Cyanosarcina cf. burmensis CCALA 770]|nr:tyrosinase [Cyanosarcina cf. burmensis CCALA 770]